MTTTDFHSSNNENAAVSGFTFNTGISPHSVYQQQPYKAPEPISKSQDLTSGYSIYGAVYSGVPVYEMMCRNVVFFIFFNPRLSCVVKKTRT